MMSAETWALALKTAGAGITGVFVVMAFLQLSTKLTSMIIKSMEKPKEAKTSTTSN